MKKSETQTRQFLGTIGNKVKDFENKTEMAFQKAHLKAYLKGSKYFQFGFRDGINGREPAMYVVQQNLSVKLIQSN